jgi:uncharacterized protein (TIGR03067 family)
MRAFTTAAVLTLVLSGPGATRDPAQTDQQAVQGDWEVVEHLPADAIPPVVYTRVVFAGDKLTLHCRLEDQTASVTCTFKLDPKGSPKQMDFTPARGGKPYLAIYALKDGKLRIAYRGPTSTRPKDFADTRAGNLVTTFLTLKPRSA